MRSVPIALRVVGAAAGVLVMAPVAGAAHAEEAGRIKVTVRSATVRPGGEVELTVTGCKGRTGVAKSRAFVSDAKLSGGDWSHNSLSGKTKAKSGGSAGGYGIDVTCDGEHHRGAGRIKVAHGGGDREEGGKRDQSGRQDQNHEQDNDLELDLDEYRSEDRDKGQDRGKDQGEGRGKGDDEDRSQDHDPDPSDTPYAPVRAGGGGTAAALVAEEDDQDRQGPSTPHAVIGLVLAAAAAVSVAFRSARRRRMDATDRD